MIEEKAKTKKQAQKVQQNEKKKRQKFNKMNKRLKIKRIKIKYLTNNKVSYSPISAICTKSKQI